nr:MAG TPA: tail connector protein [Caudoviricetes sp.]
MLEVEKIELVKAMTGETSDGVVSAYLKIAGNKICRKAFPFDPAVTEVPEQYSLLQVEIAVYLLNKRGAEGQTSHSENGISRSYEDGDVPPTMLRQIVPMAGVL